MGKIATIGEIQEALGLPNPPSGWLLTRCPTRGELSTIWGSNIAWAGDSGYASNRLVELSMVENSNPTKTVTLECSWNYGSGIVYLKVGGELTLFNGTKFPFLVSNMAPAGLTFVNWADLYIYGVPDYGIITVNVTEVKYAISRGSAIIDGGLNNYIIHNNLNSVVLNLVL